MVLVVTHLVVLKMAAVEGEHVQILSGDLEAIQTHGDSSSFQNSCPGLNYPAQQRKQQLVRASKIHF